MTELGLFFMFSFIGLGVFLVCLAKAERIERASRAMRLRLP